MELCPEFSIDYDFSMLTRYLGVCLRGRWHLLAVPSHLFLLLISPTNPLSSVSFPSYSTLPETLSWNYLHLFSFCLYFCPLLKFPAFTFSTHLCLWPSPKSSRTICHLPGSFSVALALLRLTVVLLLWQL